MIHATRIDPRRASTPLLVTGRVANLDTSARTFSVNGQVVSYATAILRDLASPRRRHDGSSAAQALDRDTLVADEVNRRRRDCPVKQAPLRRWKAGSRASRPRTIRRRRPPGGGQSSQANDVVRLDAFVSGKGCADRRWRGGGQPMSRPSCRAGWSGRHDRRRRVRTIGTHDSEGAFRLNVEEPSGGPPVLDSGLGQLVGTSPSADAMPSARVS